MSELVLLGIFIVGLMIAWLIVAEKTRVTFSDPIKLQFAGVSASVPHGEGWQVIDEWQFNGDKNGYYLASWLKLGDQEKIYCQWECLVAEPGGVPEDKLKESVAKSNGVIIEDGELNQSDLTFVWVKFTQASRDKEGLVALAELPSGKHLKVIILTDAESASLVPLFEKAIKSVRYQPNELLEQSSEFVEHLKSIGVAALLKNKSGQLVDNLNLVKKDLSNNRGRRVIGFTIERFEDFDDEYTSATLRAKQLHYIQGPRGWKDVASFQCDDSCSEFRWENNRQFVNGSSMVDTSISCDAAGGMTVVRDNKESYFQLSNIAIPDMITVAAAEAFIDYDADEQLLEIVSHDGQVMPARLSKVKPGEVDQKNQVAYIVKLDYLNQSKGYNEVFFFDADRNVIKKISHGEQILILDPTNWPDLIMGFSELNRIFDEMFPGKSNLKI